MAFFPQNVSPAKCAQAFVFFGIVAWPAARRRFSFKGFGPARSPCLPLPFEVGLVRQPGRVNFGQVFWRGCLASGRAARVAARHGWSGLRAGVPNGVFVGCVC